MGIVRTQHDHTDNNELVECRSRLQKAGELISSWKSASEPSDEVQMAMFEPFAQPAWAEAHDKFAVDMRGGLVRLARWARRRRKAEHGTPTLGVPKRRTLSLMDLQR